MDPQGKFQQPSNPSPPPQREPIAFALHDPAKQLQIGQLIDGRYKVISVIAAGGFGYVYKVQQILMNQTFALKTLNPIAANETTMLRLRKEAQALSRLDHPNLVRAIDFGFIDSVEPFLVMEYVQGPTLAEYLKRKGRLSLEEALQIFLPIVHAMVYVHSEGIIHRDIKPGNIILDTDQKAAGAFVPKVVDFGIAKLGLGSESESLALTKTGDIFGTPLYMSPEQCAGTAVDERSDVYALGCVLFESLSGTPPFRGLNVLDTMMKHSSASRPSLKEASLGEEFPVALELVLGKMLAIDPRDRYQNFIQLAEDLIMLQRGDHQSMRVVSKSQRKKFESPRERNLLILGSMIFALILGVIAGSTATYFLVPQTQKLDPILLDNFDAKFKAEHDGPAPSYDGDGYFRKEEDSRQFRFPRKGEPLGVFQVWGAEATPGKSIEASGTRTLPKKRIVFRSYDRIMLEPGSWGRFRGDDLDGVDLNTDSPALFDVHSMGFAVAAAAQQQNLQALNLDNLELPASAMPAIGQAKKLKWLGINNAVIVSDDGKLRLINAADVLTLPQLKNLETLNLNSVVKEPGGITKVLEHLQGGRIKRLRISLCGDLGQREFELIAGLKTLQTLVIRGIPQGKNLAGGDSLMEQLAKLPHLKNLGMDMISVTVPPAGKGFPELQHLALSAVLNKRVPTTMLKKWLPESARISESKEHNRDEIIWFDPFLVNPFI